MLLMAVLLVSLQAPYSISILCYPDSAMSIGHGYGSKCRPLTFLIFKILGYGSKVGYVCLDSSRKFNTSYISIEG